MSNSGYRRDFVPRGGGGGSGYTRGRGRGGGFNSKPRPRYWDNDDYYDRDKGRGGKRRYSRSTSRSYSRSRSRSKSRSRSSSPRSPRERRTSRGGEDYSPRRTSVDIPSHGGGPAPVPPPPLQDPTLYVHQPMKAVENVDVNKWRPAEYGSHLQTNGGSNDRPPIQASMELQDFMKKQQQVKNYQHQQHSVDDPSLTFGGYGYPNENVPQLYPPSSMDGYNVKAVTAVGEPESMSSKKKKEKRKKKKSRRRSSSSSSSSSDSSSDGSRRKRKSKRDSDDSSNSSSENELKHQKEKEKPTTDVTGSRLTEEQRLALITQQDAYSQKLDIIEREIGKLQAKEDELKKIRADIRLVEENLKLQAELKGRCKAVHIVLEKINNVLVADKGGGPDKSHALVPPPAPKLSEPIKPVEMKLTRKDLTDVDYIDNGQHWCRLCNIFPETVEQMLSHFHSQAHRDQVEQLGIDDKPWHKRNISTERLPSAAAKKLPMRGIQFFSPVEGWYCRLCNSWMGDQHCSLQHLKSLEHNQHYMTFLDEHADWETKWNGDREKARLRALGEVKTDQRKSRFDATTIDDNSGSIRVQMRNTIKTEDTKAAGFFAKSETKDTGIDEWMGKPQKVPLDIVDTQKFAEIVRQRHGAVKKEEEAAKLRESALVLSKSMQPKGRDQDGKRDEAGGRETDKRRTERVEMQIAARETRDRDRDRYRENRGGVGGRRKYQPTRSRSRSRDRGYHGRRRSRSRSRSRSRERRDRDKNTRGGAEPIKKQMPIIGKMPLYKRPLNAGKDKHEETEKSTVVSDEISQSLHYSEPSVSSGQYEEIGSVYDESYSHSQHMSVSSSYEPSTEHSTYSTSAHIIEDSSVYVPVEAATMVPRPDTDLKPPGEKEAPGGTNLPDDLQHALDIIYRGGGKPITIPPPNFPTSVPPPSMPMMGVPPPGQAGYDYSSMTSAFPPNYMSYEPYQMSFDGYAASDMEEIVAPGNVPVVENPTPTVQPETNVEDSSAAAIKTTTDPENGEGDDDMDDLRMLGIDVDDVAVVRK